MPPPPSGKASPSPAKSAYTGRTIARCLVGEKLGRGATSHVFRARHEGLGKDVALKILSAEAAGSEEMRKRFLSEARAIAKLSHENIVKVYDTVEDQGLLCILMELVPGGTLQDKLDDEGALEPRIAFRIAAEIARALEAAHEMKLVHRDIKPANVMLSGQRGEEVVKVVDFGLAVQAEMNRVGTPMFMSPEAAQGKRIDEKSDVYALGVCLYQMLTGVLPFTGASVKEILAAQVSMEAIPPSQRRLVLGTQFDDVVKKLLVKSKGYRPSAGEAADLLEDIADELDERAEGVQKIRRRKKRPKKKVVKKSNAMLWVGVAVAAVLIVMIFIFASGHDPAPPDAGRAAGEPAGKTEVVVVDPAQRAYEGVETWAAANPDNPAEEGRRWAEVEQRYPGTQWASKAGTRRLGAEDRVRQKQAKAERDAAAKAAEIARQNDPVVKYARMNALLAEYQFSQAYDIMGELPPPPGTDELAWSERLNRIEYLGRHFVDEMGRGIEELFTARRPFKANVLFGDTKDDEVLKMARQHGVTVVNAAGEERTVPWSKMKKDALFLMRGGVYDKILSSGEMEDNLVLACLAVETGQTPKVVGNFRDVGLGFIADPDDRALKRRQLFGEE